MENKSKDPVSQTYIKYPHENDIKSRIISALLELYRHDFELLDANVNERSITHKLAEYLQRQFPYWHVDCEYNRRREEPKEFDNAKVVPDIIVHRRRTKHNLLVIEVKKGDSSSSKDVIKLRRFIKVPEFRYRLGVFLALGASGCSKAVLFRSNGKKIDWTDEIQRSLGELGYGR